MSKKFQVCIYQEIFTTYEIEADSEDHAVDLVLSGEFDEIDQVDVDCKNSEVEYVKEILD